jgi:glutamate-1-semialdehyde aminotransferase
MIELAAMIAVSAIALTFLTDATSDTMRLARAMSRRKQDKIRVADHH